MQNRPSLVVALCKPNRPYKHWDRNPMSVATANQLNALREYIEDLERQVELIRNTPDGDGTPEGPASDTGGSSEAHACKPEDRNALG